MVVSSSIFTVVVERVAAGVDGDAPGEGVMLSPPNSSQLLWFIFYLDKNERQRDTIIFNSCRQQNHNKLLINADQIWLI